MISWDSQAELSIEIHVVVPGQPGDRVQLSTGQPQHLRKTRRKVSILVEQPLCCHKVLVTHDLDRSRVDARKALSDAFARCQNEGTACHLDPADIHMHR